MLCLQAEHLQRMSITLCSCVVARQKCLIYRSYKHNATTLTTSSNTKSQIKFSDLIFRSSDPDLRSNHEAHVIVTLSHATDLPIIKITFVNYARCILYKGTTSRNL